MEKLVCVVVEWTPSGSGVPAWALGFGEDSMA